MSEIALGCRSARVTIGIVPEGTICYEDGLIVTYGFRVILKGTRIGLGNEPTPGLFGWVDLLQGWELSKNKDKIVGLEDLSDAIYERCKTVIDIAVRRSRTIAFHNVARQVNNLFSEALSELGRMKERRYKKKNNGKSESKNTGRRRRSAAKTQPGDSFDDIVNSSKGLQVSFNHYGADGPAWKCQDNIVYLNSDNTSLATDRSNDRVVTFHAIHAASCYLVMSKKAAQLSFMRDAEKEHEQVAKLTGYLLSRLDNPSDVRIAEAT